MRWGDDVLVSCYGYGGTLKLFDADNSTGNLFSLIHTYYSEEGFMYLSVSLDTGKTWTCKYSWSYASSSPTDMGGVVMGDYFYTVVAWDYGETIHRFSTITGIFDSTYDTAAVVRGSGNVTKRELASSQTYSTPRLYYYGRYGDTLLFYWSEDSGKTWTPDYPGIKNISGAFDVCGNEGGLSEEPWCCYRGQNDSLYAASRSDSLWTNYGPFDYIVDAPSIDAYKDTVVIVYPGRAGTDSNYIKYVVSYNGGSDWVSGVLYGPSAEVGNSPDVTAGDGYGFGVVYTVGGEGFYIHKNPLDASWSEPVSFADTGTVWHAKIEQIVGGIYGIVYQGSPVKFDRSDWISGIEEEPVSGDDLFIISANPSVFSSQTSIQYFLPTKQAISLAVYDVLGSHIRTLVSGGVSAGRNSASWDGKDDLGNPVASGVYVCILKVDEKPRLSTRVTLIK